MKGIIIGFERTFVNVEVEDEKTKKPVVEQHPAAILHIQTDMPEILPVGKVIELDVVAEEPTKDNKKKKKN